MIREPFRYRDRQHLIEALDREVIDEAESMFERILTSVLAGPEPVLLPCTGSPRQRMMAGREAVTMSKMLGILAAVVLAASALKLGG